MHVRPRRQLRARVIMMASVIVSIAAGAPHASAQFGADAPRAIRSESVERIASEIEATPAQRAAFGHAMDAYVARWKSLRDGTLTRTFAELADQESARMVAVRRAALEGAQSSASDRAEGDRLQQLRARACAVTIEAIEIQNALFAALMESLANDPSARESQRIALEQWTIRERRRALFRCLPGRGVRGVPSMSSAMQILEPPAEALADPAVRDEVARRILRHEKDSIPALERQLRMGLPTDPSSLTVAGPDGEPSMRVRGASVEGIAQLKLIAEIASLLPIEHRTSWSRRARRRAITAWFGGMEDLVDPSRVSPAATGDAKVAVDARMASWESERDRAEAAIADAVSEEDLAARVKALADIDVAALQELQERSGDPQLEFETVRLRMLEQEMRERMSAAQSFEPDEDSGLPAAALRSIADRSARSVGMREGDEEEDGEQASIQKRMATLGILRRADLEEMRARLGIGESGTQVWDTLATDLMASLVAIRDAATEEQKAVFNGSGGPEAILQFGKARTKFIEAVGVAENKWLDAVAIAFPDIAPTRIEAERGRRALRRIFEASALMLTQVRLFGNRWLDTDLDAAADQLPERAREALAPELVQWRARKTEDVRALCTLVDRMITGMTPPSGGVIDEQYMARMQATRERINKELASVSKAAEQAQAYAVESMAKLLGPGDAAHFRGAVRRQESPEVYREQDTLDEALDRVLADPTLDSEQKAAVAIAWEAARVGFEPIAAQLVEAWRDTEAAMGAMVSRGGSYGDEDTVSRMRRQRDAALRLDALEYDAAELRAHTVRAVRQAVGYERANSAGLR